MAGEGAYAVGGARGMFLCLREVAILFFAKTKPLFWSEEEGYPARCGIRFESNTDPGEWEVGGGGNG